MWKKDSLMNMVKKSVLIFSLLGIIALGITVQEGAAQYFDPFFYVNPYFTYIPFTPWAPVPFIPTPIFPVVPYFPTPFTPAPYIRSPQATIILSTGITAISPAAGVLTIGAPTVVTPTTTTTVVSTTVPTLTTAAPAPLFSILSVLYASALYESPLSIANPLLFAYLSTLVI